MTHNQAEQQTYLLDYVGWNITYMRNGCTV